MPTAYTCDGMGSTLPLSWTGAPAATKEFALLMTTLPGDGTTKWNWVLYHIPATATHLAKDTFLVGTLGVGSDGPGAIYDPPCSRGPGPKVYTWTLYALSDSPVFNERTNRITGNMVTDAIRGITLASASMSLTYSRTVRSPGSSEDWVPPEFAARFAVRHRVGELRRHVWLHQHHGHHHCAHDERHRLHESADPDTAGFSRR